MIPLIEPNLSGNESQYLQECIDTTFVSSVGPFVQRFEAQVMAATGAAAAVATSAGTTGLHAALLAVGVRPGDLVIVPSYTFIASANAVAHCGAYPWLVDIAASSWTLDPALLERVLSTETRKDGDHLIHEPTGQRVAAVMPVHTLGAPADMDSIVGIAKKHGLKVVADAAAALGARYRGLLVGEIGADLSVLSFNGNKTVTAGGGGAVIGTDLDLVTLVRHLTTTARVGSDYSHDRVGYNYRMTNLQAAVGCAQMERLDGFVAAKRRIRRLYDENLTGLAGIRPFPSLSWAESACWIAGVVVGSPAPSADVIRQRLRDAGVEARPFWSPIHQQGPYKECPKTSQDVCEALWRNVVTLPCSTHLPAADQAKVIAAFIEAARP